MAGIQPQGIDPVSVVHVETAAEFLVVEAAGPGVIALIGVVVGIGEKVLEPPLFFFVLGCLVHCGSGPDSFHIRAGRAAAAALPIPSAPPGSLGRGAVPSRDGKVVGGRNSPSAEPSSEAGPLEPLTDSRFHPRPWGEKIKVVSGCAILGAGYEGLEAMQFIVRYWINQPPVHFDGGRPDGAEWIDHSSHPAGRLGLHNAILSAEDRLSVLRHRHGAAPHGCDIFIESAERQVVLSVAEAEELLELLQGGSLSWEAFEALLAAHPSATGKDSGGNSVPTVSGDHVREVAEYGSGAAEGRHRIDFDA